MTDQERKRYFQLIKRKERAKEVLKKFGTIGVVLFYRSQQYGTKYDITKSMSVLKTDVDWIDVDGFMMDHFIKHCLIATMTSFEILRKEASSETKKAYQVLEMVYKMLPKDNQKIKRIALEKILPSLHDYLASIDTN